MELKNKLSDYIVAIENFLPNSKNQKLREILDFNFFQFKKAEINTGVTKENHIDNKVRITHTDSGKNMPRTLSYVYFINDDYKGGELIFELPTNEVIKVNIQKNKLIMFPSNFLYPHKVLPVEEGVKYSVVSWAS